MEMFLELLSSTCQNNMMSDKDLFDIEDNELVSFRAKCEVMDTLEIPENVTAIKDGALSGSCFRRVRFLGDVSFIGGGAFASCSNLESITIPQRVKAINAYTFTGCDKLSEVSIPAGVESIGKEAFKDCRRLQKIKIPDDSHLQSIGDAAFYNTALKSIAIPESVIAIGQTSFFGEYGAFEIEVDPENRCFKSKDGNLYTYDMKKLLFANHSAERLVIPDSVTCIGAYSCCNCSNLKYVRLPDGVVNIEDYAFAYCGSLNEIDSPTGENLCDTLNLPNDLTGIGSRAFLSCFDVKYVTIPAGLRVINNEAFDDCARLEAVSVSGGLSGAGNLKRIGDYAFSECRGLRSIDLSGVYDIGEGAFYDCPSLADIGAINFCASIKKCAFEWCSSLPYWSIPRGTNIIPCNVFDGCTGLKYIIMSSDVTSIDKDAFGRCLSLERVYYCGTAMEWSKISIADGNDVLTKGKVYFYSEKEPHEIGNYL